MLLISVPVRTKSQKGFILVAVVAIVLIAALVALAQNVLQNTQRTLNKQTGDMATLNNLDAAMVNFVSMNRRLPCPANGALAMTGAGAGIEQSLGGPCNPLNEINGVVPWITLGLPASAALDAWGNQITYRVDPALASNNLLMNMSTCYSAGTLAPNAVGACIAAPPCAGPASCTSIANFYLNKGLDVWKGGAQVAARGTSSAAAYVLISHGQNGAGAHNTGGALLPTTVPPGTGTIGANEQANFNGQPLILPPLAGASKFNDYPFNTGAAAQYFDDQIHYPSITTVLKKAGLYSRN